jgi:hypothetical protein
MALGSRLREQADAAAVAGHLVSARGGYLRAAEYFQQAFFFHRDNLNGPHLRATYRASVQAFRAALPLLSHPAWVRSGRWPGYLFTLTHPLMLLAVRAAAAAGSAPNADYGCLPKR